MGYQIIYKGPMPKVPVQKAGSIRLRTLVAVCLLLFSIMVRLLWPDGATMLRTVFLPGDLTVTETAFSELVQSMKDGQSLEEAVTVFCRKIIHESP